MADRILDFSHIPTLLIVGCAIFGGSMGARVFQRLRIPQVVGYIVIGLLVGKSGLRIIDDSQIKSLLPFNIFALGVIGFMIGGELHRNVFKKYGRQFLTILLSEGLSAFAVVTLLVSGVTYLITRDVASSVAFGLVLGAISSATAPAATVDVLWEYKSRGVLSTTVLAIVALDDGLALLLYSLASSAAMLLTGRGEMAIGAGLLHTIYELGIAVILGALASLSLNYLLRNVREYEKMLTFIIGVLTILLGVALLLKVDVILTAMTLGMVLVNLAPHRSREAFQIVERFAAPIYVLFFVCVGARLSVRGLSSWMWWLALAYVVGRTGGKMLGAWFGAWWSGAAESVRKYLGLCLFSQAGVAIGLAILSSVRFSQPIFGHLTMGDAIIMIVTATTFFVQVIGPPCVKVALKRAGEIGLNVTEEDLVNSFTVQDAMNPSAPKFSENTTVTELLATIAKSDAMSYPVIDMDGRVVGIITMEEIKECLGNLGMGDWLVAFDLMRPTPDTVRSDTPLADALNRMQQQKVECLPVVEQGPDSRYAGLLESTAVRSMISQEVLRRHRLADGKTVQG